jgi:hypothetical protein
MKLASFGDVTVAYQELGMGKNSFDKPQIKGRGKT